MSLSSTASARRPVRAVIAVAVAVAVLAPLAVLCAQVWSGTRASLQFTADERRGAEYLGPLTRLLSAATEDQSAAVRGERPDGSALRSAAAAVDAVDARIGGGLRTTERWTTARATVADRAGRIWPVPSVAYAQYSDLATALLELNRTAGDSSRLILDPALDSYYVMNATLLRIPAILVDSGRYTDLRVLAAAARPDATGQAQLSAARNRVATDAADLSDGLVKAFAETDSSTLGPELTRQLDNFRTAVDAVAPSSSLLAPVPQRSLSDLSADQQVLRTSALALQDAALRQLDLLLAAREDGQQRSRVVALAAIAAGVLVAVVLAALAWRWTAPGRPARGRSARPDPADVPAPTVPDRVAVGVPGGARAAR